MPAGLHVETGAPPFVAVGVETIGLSASPTSLARMPDGRLLLTAPRQIALGDGVRWEVFQQSPEDPLEAGPSAVVGDDGRIHLATPQGVTRVEFRGDGTWHLVPVLAWSDAPGGPAAMPQAAVNDLGGHWLWHGLSGPVLSWRPGSAPRRLATADTFEHVFRIDDAVYLSERFRGRLSRIDTATPSVLIESSTLTAITCSAPFEPGLVLAGTYGAGLRLFDGTTLRPFPAGGPLATGARIQDICTTHGGHFAVAIDNHGLVFVARDGRILQALDRSIESRLARARQLVATDDGAVWALHESGLVRVAFPSPVSYFESMIGPGVTTVHPRRVDGDLWLLADGRLHRGTYDTADHLSGFEPDAPPDVFVNSFAEVPGWLIAGTEQGAWCRPKSGGPWTPFAEDVANMHVLDAQPIGGRWLYVARDEAGWLELGGSGPRVADRYPVPGQTNVFNRPLRDSRGRYWLELGTGRISRVEVRAGTPIVTILDARHGIPANWPQGFLLEGEFCVNFNDRVHRFDEATQRFVHDPAFAAALPDVHQFYGRPALGPDGRLWVAGDGVVRVLKKHEGRWRQDGPAVHAGFMPYYLTVEESGVVWMHAQHRLARFDPRMPAAPVLPIAATITNVRTPATNRHFFDPDDRIPPLDSGENSLVARFTTRAENFGTPVTFEVALRGSGREWVDATSSGTAVFNNLGHGDYVLHVRPVADGIAGTADSLAFTIHPPWYRTAPAYLAAIVALAGLVAAIGRTGAYLARRESRRLERLVAERTADLRGSEERYRRLNQELEQRVAVRTQELHLANQRLHEANVELAASNRELESFSYSVSHDLRAPLRGIDGWSLALQEDYGDRIDDNGRVYLQRVRTETQRLSTLIDDLLKLARTTRAEFTPAELDLSALVAATAHRVANIRPDSKVAFTCQPGLHARGDRALLEAALYNLLDNAWKFSAGRDQPRVEFGQTATPHGAAFFVRDNGAGFDMRHARKLFGVFQRMHAQNEFPGTGIGLATVQRIIHRHAGRIWATSEPNAGATFFFTLGGDTARAPHEP